MPEKREPVEEGGVASALAGLRQVPDEPAPPPALPIDAETLDYIKKQIADAVASGIEEGSKRVREQYHEELESVGTMMKVAAVSQVVTAVGIVAILVAILATNAGKE